MEPVRTLQAGELVEQLDDGSFRVVQQSQPSLYQDGNENNKLDSMAIQEFNPPGMVPSQPMQIIQQGPQFMPGAPVGPMSMGAIHGPPPQIIGGPMMGGPPMGMGMGMPMGGPMMGPMGPPPNITEREFRGRQNLDMLTVNPDMINMMSDQDLEDVLKELDKETGSAPCQSTGSWLSSCCAFIIIGGAIIVPLTYFLVTDKF